MGIETTGKTAKEITEKVRLFDLLSSITIFILSYNQLNIYLKFWNKFNNVEGQYFYEIDIEEGINN